MDDNNEICFPNWVTLAETYMEKHYTKKVCIVVSAPSAEDDWEDRESYFERVRARFLPEKCCTLSSIPSLIFSELAVFVVDDIKSAVEICTDKKNLKSFNMLLWDGYQFIIANKNNDE